MRTISGARNRTILLIGGLLMLIPAALVVLAATPVGGIWPQAQELLGGDATAASLSRSAPAWLPAAGFAVAVIVLIIGVALLLAQIPRQPARAAIRITDDGDRLLGSIEPEVLERALVQGMEATTGVVDASVRIGGGAREPWIQASATIAEEAELAWSAALLRRRIRDEVTTALGTAPARIDLLIRLRSRRRSSGAEVGTVRDTSAQEPSAGSAARGMSTVAAIR